jgi:putative spermidine/putrescine transport system permease protein
VVGIFLIVPTVTVIVNAVFDGQRFSLTRVEALFSETALTALGRSMLLAASTAIVGAVFGALLAWLIVSRSPTSIVRRVVVSMCSVLAQFGGVALAFAFLATIGLNGVLTLWVREHLGWDLTGSGWLYELPGLMLVYSYFQIPLMVVVFLPALEGLRPQWREAAASLGASTWQYWSAVGMPLLRPAFLGSALLLFANAFAAYATAAALISQGSPIVPLLIRAALTSEVVLGQEGFAYALALEMIVVVALVMVAYNASVRRTARWLG